MTTTLNQSIQSQVRTIDGLSIRYAESEPRDDHALLFSPWPESIYCYEPTWTRLAEHVHLVAIDLPGFGQSERRDSLMSPKAMGEFIVRLADACGNPTSWRPTSVPVLHERLPKSKLEIIDTGHFIWEDAADTYASLVTSWWAGGYAKAGSGCPR
jgi:pimeloyl-ACP methyl ester carboxylesterase